MSTNGKVTRRTAVLVTGCCLAAAAAGGVIYRGLSRRNKAVSGKAPFRMQSPWINDAEFIGYFVALYQDWYASGEDGIDMKYLPGGPEVLVEGTLLSGQAELALAPVETVAKLVQEQKAPFVIIGAQYQKSPVGIVSLASAPIKSPADLVGKRLAVPAANLLSVDALLRLNSIDKNQVNIVPYQYDPMPLINGDVDATLDFVTNVPFTIQTKGREAFSFLLYDHGFKVFNDVVVVTRDVLTRRREDIQTWLRASRRGWAENFRDAEKYPKLFMKTWYSKTGRTVENELFFNKAQKPLIEHPRGIFTMTPSAIKENIDTLGQVGIKVDETLFDSTVLAESGD